MYMQEPSPSKFIVKNPEILKQVYSGKFRQNDSIESILQAIKDVGKFQYRILSDKEIEIFWLMYNLNNEYAYVKTNLNLFLSLCVRSMI